LYYQRILPINSLIIDYIKFPELGQNVGGALLALNICLYLIRCAVKQIQTNEIRKTLTGIETALDSAFELRDVKLLGPKERAFWSWSARITGELLGWGCFVTGVTIIATSFVELRLQHLKLCFVFFALGIACVGYARILRVQGLREQKRIAGNGAAAVAED
jgi:hypothetical protein